MERLVGTVSRGVRAPIIREGDDLAKIVVDSVLAAGKSEGFSFHDRDVVAVTEAVVARAQGNYAHINDIAADVKNKLGGETIGVIFPILSRNRFSVCLKGIARGAKKVVLMLSFPADEVGNHLIDEELLDEKGVYMVNVLASPGSGKTSTIVATINALRDKYNIAVIEGDIASDVDAVRMKEAGMPAIQINTGGLCHLEGNMIGQAVDAFDDAVGLDAIDVIFIENVGNLVCPVDFDLGENLSIMILSVPEGDDKPLKYPGIFQHAGALLLNKVDVAPAFDFDFDAYGSTLDDLNPAAPRFEVSATRGQGMDAWCDWLAEEIEAARTSQA